MLETSDLKERRVRKSYTISVERAQFLRDKAASFRDLIKNLDTSKNGKNRNEKSRITRQQNKIRKELAAMEEQLKDAPPVPIDPADVNRDIRQRLEDATTRYEDKVDEFLNNVEESGKFTWYIQSGHTERIVMQEWIADQSLGLLTAIENQMAVEYKKEMTYELVWFRVACEMIETRYKELVRQQLQPYSPNIRSTSMVFNATEYWQHVERAKYIEKLEYWLLQLAEYHQNILSWIELGE